MIFYKFPMDPNCPIWVSNYAVHKSFPLSLILQILPSNKHPIGHGDRILKKL